ncbi:MAG TPA: hypothetical protein VFF52_30290 [Isosphaeraceae bacterium]|nr:hypothetical protein [Isosphaeraceae bacterium]
MTQMGSFPRTRKRAERTGSRRAVLIGLVVWGLTLVGGLLALNLHEATPGLAGRGVAQWPGDSRLVPAKPRATLIMAAHPRCPCTRASVSELAQVLSRCAGLVEVYVLVFTPGGPEPSWRPPDFLSRLGTLPGVHLLDDPGGIEAARFGAATSGHVALYGPDGRLRFHGGITGARGHEGNNGGRRAVLGAIANSSTCSPQQSLVFGCPLFSAPSPSAGRVSRGSD